MTNREWLLEMDDKTLAEFLTLGIMVNSLNLNTDPFRLRIHDISRQYTSSALGVEMWLSLPQQYTVVK